MPAGRTFSPATQAGHPVSAGFVHSCLAKAAELIADVVKLIKTLITAAAVAGFDETTLTATAATQLLCPGQGVQRRTGVQVPHPHRLVAAGAPHHQPSGRCG